MALLDLIAYQPRMTIRRCRQLFAVAVIFAATPCMAGPSDGDRLPQTPDRLAPITPVSNDVKPQVPDIDLYALISGKCSTLEIAGRDFACRSVAYFHSKQGRASFSIALDDPADSGHIISFSGENGRRAQDDVYELPVDRMLLNSRTRPKVDGLPVPTVELSAGRCTQLGNFAAGQVSSISCAATDNHGKKYRITVRVRRLADYRAQDPAIGAVDPRAPVRRRRRAHGRRVAARVFISWFYILKLCFCVGTRPKVKRRRGERLRSP